MDKLEEMIKVLDVIGENKLKVETAKLFVFTDFLPKLVEHINIPQGLPVAALPEGLFPQGQAVDPFPARLAAQGQAVDPFPERVIPQGLPVAAFPEGFEGAHRQAVAALAARFTGAQTAAVAALPGRLETSRQAVYPLAARLWFS